MGKHSDENDDYHFFGDAEDAYAAAKNAEERKELELKLKKRCVDYIVKLTKLERDIIEVQLPTLDKLLAYCKESAKVRRASRKTTKLLEDDTDADFLDGLDDMEERADKDLALSPEDGDLSDMRVKEHTTRQTKRKARVDKAAQKAGVEASDFQAMLDAGLADAIDADPASFDEDIKKGNTDDTADW